MPRVELPKNSFLPHPVGQGSGTIFDVEVQENIKTQYGTSNRIVLKIASDKELEDEDGRKVLTEDGENMYFTIWDFVTISRNGRLKDRREAILKRPLTREEMGADTFDPDAEFKGKRIGFVIKHSVGKGGDKVFANIDTLWLLDDQKPNKDHLRLLNGSPSTASEDDSSFNDPPTINRVNSKLIDQAEKLEKLTGFGASKLANSRMKYLGEEYLQDVTDKEAMEAYIEKLNTLVDETGLF